MTSKLNPPTIPVGLLDVALVDGPACAAAAGVGISTWHEMVRSGLAPAPAFRAPRHTRWQLGIVRTWLIERAAAGSAANAEASVMLQVKKAAAASRAKRAATRSQVGA